MTLDEYLEEMKKKWNYDAILKAKKIKSYVDMISPRVLPNHLVMGWMQKTSGQQVDKEIAEESAKKGGLLSFAGMKSILPKNMMAWDNVFCIMVTSKAFVYSSNLVSVRRGRGRRTDQ